MDDPGLVIISPIERGSTTLMVSDCVQIAKAVINEDSPFRMQFRQTDLVLNSPQRDYVVKNVEL